MNKKKKKKWLSYLTEIHIESAPSEINPHLYVSLRRGRYQLCTANAIYSYEDLYDNFVKAFERIQLDKIEGDRVLILGFGLGSIPLILENKFNRNFHYTAVELDESVLYLANKYTVPKLDAAIDFVQADALAFVEQCQEKFDVICMDVFLDDVIPTQFHQNAFLRRLQQLLTRNGLLLYNCLALTDADLNATEEFYYEHFVPNFPQGKYLDVDGNWILVNDRLFLKND
ncbi:MAG: spermidine synthase [Saprospiraceae bacterium]